MDYNNTKGTSVGVVAVAIAILALGISVFGGSTEQSQNVGGQRAGVQEFIDGVKPGDLTVKTLTATMAPLANSVKIWHNDTGRDVLVDFGSASVSSAQTASSSALVSIVATTSSSVGTWVDFGTLVASDQIKNSLITAIQIATSTTASSTNSYYAAAVSKGRGAVLVPNGSYVFGVLQQDTTNSSIACAATGKCETATSTNRGYNPVFDIRILY